MMVEVNDGRRAALTIGTFTVSRILAWDREAGYVWVYGMS